jgi:hypothetical protein
MTFKEIFHINNFINRIKLDYSGTQQNLFEQQKNEDEDKRPEDKTQDNEWNQEYEMIYLSYVIEK